MYMYMFLSFSFFWPAKTRVALVKSVNYLTKFAHLITTCGGLGVSLNVALCYSFIVLLWWGFFVRSTWKKKPFIFLLTKWGHLGYM